jgi:hypothetical protein
MRVPAAIKDQVQQLGGAFMFSREAKAYAMEIGVEGFIGPYMRGRAGVLGDVDADVVTAAVGFFPADTVRAAWESVPCSSAKAAEGYARAAQEFGRRKLAGFDESVRLAELLRAVVDNADVAGVPLFAGWRAMPLPDDAPAQVLQLTHTLRELRGGLHFLAVYAGGLSPLEAVLVGGSPLADGPGQARFYGWEEPFPEVTDELRARWNEAEEVTEALITPAFEVLGASEGEELIALMAQAHGAALSR